MVLKSDGNLSPSEKDALKGRACARRMSHDRDSGPLRPVIIPRCRRDREKITESRDVVCTGLSGPAILRMPRPGPS